MAADVVMPQMGESIFEGTITKWLKKPGDKVERDEPLFEISTDKVDAEIPSPRAVVLKEIKVAEGKSVPIQPLVGVIDAAGDASAAKPAQPAASPKSEAQPAKAAQAPPSRTAAPQAPANGKGAPPAQQQARPQAAATSASAGSTGAPATGGVPTTGARDGGGRIHSSPLVRRMAKEHGIDLSGVTGTGAGGRISKQDIEALIAGGGQQGGVTEDQTDQSGEVEEELEEAFNSASSAPAPTRQAPSMPPPPRQAPPQVSSQGGAQAAGQHGGQVHAAFESAVPREKIYFGDYEVQPMSVMRQRIGEHMVASKRVSAHVYSVDEIDMTKGENLR